MTTQPLVRMYASFQSAARAVRELQAAGIVSSDISILAKHSVDRGTNGMTPDRLTLTEIGKSSRIGSGAGTAIGAGSDLVAGLVLMTSSDFGPVVAAGWLASPAAFQVPGSEARGLVGTLTGSGVNERRARLYANGVRGGATLVAVRCDGEHHSSAETILRGHSPIDPEVHDLAQRYGGWNAARFAS